MNFDIQTMRLLSEDAAAVGIKADQSFFAAPMGETLLEAPASVMVKASYKVLSSLSDTFEKSSFKDLHAISVKSNGDVTTSKTLMALFDHNTKILLALEDGIRKGKIPKDLEISGFSKDEITLFTTKVKELRHHNGEIVTFIRENDSILREIKQRGEEAGSKEAVIVVDVINTVLLAKISAVTAAANMLLVISFTNGQAIKPDKRAELIDGINAICRVAIDQDSMEELETLLATMRTSLNESVMAVAAVVIAGATMVVGFVLLIRLAISMYYKIRMIFHEDFVNSATALKINAHLLSASNPKAAAKQRKIAEKYMARAEYWRVEDPDAAKKATKAIAKATDIVRKDVDDDIEGASISIPDSYDDSYKQIL